MTDHIGGQSKQFQVRRLVKTMKIPVQRAALIFLVYLCLVIF